MWFPPKLVKLAAGKLRDNLALVFNYSIEQGISHEKFKTGFIFPIQKGVQVCRLNLSLHRVIHIVHRGRGGVNPNVYDCVQGGKREFMVAYVNKNFFWPTKSQNFSSFVQKKLLHRHLLLCIEKCKPALSYS